MLYEPTNIVPSTLTNTGAIDVNDNIEISWQVNGNSKLIGFKIDMYENNDTSTLVGSTGEIYNTSGNSTPLPFFGHNSLGEIVRYTYAPNVKWNNASIFNMENNKHYKYRITQYYTGGDTAQTSYSALDTYTTPTISITLTNNSGDTFTNTLDSSIFNAVGNYAQAQGVNIQSVRWQLYENGTLIDDTGAIDTADLAYQYSGAQNGFEYRLVCTVISESGQVPTPAEQTFTVHYDTEHAGDGYQSDFTAQCVCNDDSVLMSWNRLPFEQIIIPGDNEGGYSVNSQNQLILPESASVTWDKVQKAGEEEKPMNFEAPWTAVWKADLPLPRQENVIDVTLNGADFDDTIRDIAKNATGTLVCMVGQVRGYLFSIRDNTLKFLQNITLTGTSSPPQCCAFSPDGKWLVLGADCFTVAGNNISYRNSLPFNPVQIAFLSNSTKLYAGYTYGEQGQGSGGNFREHSRLYSFDVEETTIANGTMLLDELYASFVGLVAPNTQNGYLCVSFSSGTFIYNINNQSRSTITQNGTSIHTRAMAFNPNDNILIVGDSLFQKSGSQYYYTKKIPTPLYSINTITFNPTGDKFILGGQYYSAYMYYIDGINIKQLLAINTEETEYSCTSAIFINNDMSCVISGFVYGASVVDFGYQQSQATLSVGSGVLTIAFGYSTVSLSLNSTQIGSFNTNYLNATYIVYITPSKFGVIGNQSGETYTFISLSNNDNVGSVILLNEQITNYFAIVDGDGSDIINNLTDSDFEFQWNNGNQYTLDMLANFSDPANRLDAGTGAASNNGFMLYRHDGNNNKRRELIRLPSTVGEIKDYGLRSNEDYTYTFYAYDANGAFIGQTPATIPARQFRAYSLLATQYSEIDGCYHVYKEFRFGANVQNMSVSNNANSSYVQNFTPYPTRQYSSANYKSGTLQALIGFVDQEANRYFDDTKLMDELYALSTADFTLFLRDLKGNLYMIAPNGAITMTPNNKTAAQEVTISFPWAEIGDASQVSIIQLPTDAGWNSDAQLLDVTLGIDFATGELIVTYPYPYYGTKFNYTKQTGQLRTTTPADVTPRNVILDTEPSSPRSGAVVADPDNLQGGGES